MILDLLKRRFHRILQGKALPVVTILLPLRTNGSSCRIWRRRPRAERAEPDGVVTIIRFDSIGEAQTWLNSAEYTNVKGIRHASADTRQYLVEGVPER